MQNKFLKNTEFLAVICCGGRKMDVNERKEVEGQPMHRWRSLYTQKLTAKSY